MGLRAAARRAGKYPKMTPMMAEIAKAIGPTPVWVFHGDKDEAVPVEFSRTIVQALKDAGSTNVKYTEYAGDGHQIFGKVILEPGLLEWLAAQRR